MTKDELDELDKLERAATAAPWRDSGDGEIIKLTHLPRDVWLIPCSAADIPFIVALRNCARKLIQAAREKTKGAE